MYQIVAHRRYEMLLYSTVLNINNTLTKEKLVELVIRWNQESPHKDNIIPGLDWGGDMNTRYGSDNLWLEIQEYRNKNIVAIRFEKTESDGAVWDTDYIMNFDEMKMAIRLDRSFKQDALKINRFFSTPYFINLLIEEGYLENDGEIPVSNKPIFINKDNINVLADVINENGKWKLPIIYVSKTINERDPFDVFLLAKRVKGSAHVLVEETRQLNYPLRELCNDKNNYDGGVGIYYSNSMIRNDRFLPPKFEKGRDILLERIVRRVMAIHNSEYVDPLYTWNGVVTDLTMDRLMSQKVKRKEAETQVDKVWDTFDDDLNKYQKQVDDLKKENESLRYENQQLVMKLSDQEAIPVVVMGEEQELFTGEIKDIILSELVAAQSRQKDDSRRLHVLSDVVESNDYQRLLEKKQEEAKRIFKGVKNVSGRQKSQIKDFGFTISEEGKHYKLRYYDDSRYQVSMAKTSSDGRAGANLAAEIIKKML